MNILGGPIPPPELHLARSEQRAGVVVLAATGEVDMTTGDRLHAALVESLRRPGTTSLTVDVRSLRFIDSNGVSSLIWAMQTAEERGIRFTVVNADGLVRNVFTLLGVNELFTEIRHAN